MIFLLINTRIWDRISLTLGISSLCAYVKYNKICSHLSWYECIPI
jgi:hypothetical protein